MSGVEVDVEVGDMKWSWSDVWFDLTGYGYCSTIRSIADTTSSNTFFLHELFNEAIDNKLQTWCPGFNGVTGKTLPLVTWVQSLINIPTSQPIDYCEINPLHGCNMIAFSHLLANHPHSRIIPFFPSDMTCPYCLSNNFEECDMCDPFLCNNNITQYKKVRPDFKCILSSTSTPTFAAACTAHHAKFDILFINSEDGGYLTKMLPHLWVLLRYNGVLILPYTFRTCIAIDLFASKQIALANISNGYKILCRVR